MAVGFSALRTGRLYPKEMLLVLISVTGWVDPRAIVRLEGFYVNDTSWNWTSDLPIVAQHLNHCATAFPVRTIYDCTFVSCASADVMDGQWVICPFTLYAWDMRKAYWIPEQRGQLENFGVDENVIFTLILKSVGVCGMEPACSRFTPIVGCCGNGHKSYGPMDREFACRQTTHQVHFSFSVLIRRSFCSFLKQ